MGSRKYVFKDSFAVIGKAGQGPANSPHEWILPLWNDANAHYTEVAELAVKNEGGVPAIWGAMSDVTGSNKRWDSESGLYMAGCETDLKAVPPAGWAKWVIPAQTYIVAQTTMDAYGEVFGAISNDQNINIVAAAHERYPQPENPNIVELWFPIADGKLICQSCAMPLTNPEDFGTEENGESCMDYCRHCYAGGAFTAAQSFDEAVESNIPFWRDGCKDDNEARAKIMEVFPKLKRWSKP